MTLICLQQSLGFKIISIQSINSWSNSINPVLTVNSYISLLFFRNNQVLTKRQTQQPQLRKKTMYEKLPILSFIYHHSIQFLVWSGMCTLFSSQISPNLTPNFEIDSKTFLIIVTNRSTKLVKFGNNPFSSIQKIFPSNFSKNDLLVGRI